MINQLHILSEEEKQSVLDAPIFVAIYIAGADDDINEEELDSTIKLIHTKTFSEHNSLADNIYKKLDQNSEAILGKMLSKIPGELEERNEMLTKELSKLNSILPKLNKGFALEFYNSLKDIAFYVARSSGGVMGIGKVNDKEREVLDLSMIRKP
jgi:hypothetical protein